jgi:RHS repeat-associated protein
MLVRSQDMLTDPYPFPSREMTDATGAVHAQYDYDPFGVRTKLSGDLDSDFGFTGHWHHGPSGLNLALYRAYSPMLGRWLSRDPIAERGGINLYAYCSNTPIVRTDGLGLEPKPPIEPGEVTTSGAVVSQLGESLLQYLYRHYYQRGLAGCYTTPPSPPGKCCKCCVVDVYTNPQGGGQSGYRIPFQGTGIVCSRSCDRVKEQFKNNGVLRPYVYERQEVDTDYIPW